MNVKNNESYSAQVLHFFESADIPGTILVPSSFILTRSPGT